MTDQWIAAHPDDAPKRAADIAGFLERWQRGEAISHSERVFATYGLGILAAALADSVADEQVERTTGLFEASIAIEDTVAALASLATWYAGLCERRPDLFRKPFRRNPRPGGPHGLPADLAARRRLATDEEAAEFAASTAAAFQQLAATIRPGVDAATQAARMSDRFDAPSTEWPVDQAATPTALYLWYDADDVLIYIGITGNLAGRQNQHSKRSSWAEFAARAEVKRLGSRAEAEETERRLIHELRPLFNHVHNDTPEARQRLVDYLIQHGRTDLLAPAVARG